MLVATTGLRNGELFALRPSHLDLANLEIEVADQLVETGSGHRTITTPKHGSIRTVTFAGFLQHDLKELIGHRRERAQKDDPICDGYWTRELTRGQKPLTCPVCKRKGPPS